MGNEPTPDLNDVVKSKLTEDGVMNVTVGMVLCQKAAYQFREMLKTFAPDKYLEYRKLKYPAGESVPSTHADKVAATRFLFDTARDLLCAHYVSSKE